MQTERTIAVNADDLRQLAFYTAQGILDESESADVVSDDQRAKLADLLAMSFAHGNLAADATGTIRLARARSEIGVDADARELARVLADRGWPGDSCQALRRLERKLLALAEPSAD